MSLPEALIPSAPTSSLVDFPPTKVAVTVHSQTPDPDRTIRIAHAITHPKQVWYFLACLIGLVSLSHFGMLAWTRYSVRFRGYPWQRESSTSSHPADDETNSREKQELRDEQSNRGPISLMRLPVAIVDALRTIVFRWSVPIPLGKHYTINVMEVFLTAVYIVICFTWSMINTTSTKGVKWDPHYYANIAGNIASVQLPLVTALGMKNNIISFLTGISFDKLLYLHGMTARVLVVLIWLHAGGRGALGFKGEVALTNPEIQVGLLAGVALTLLAVVSIRPVRDRAYEIFLIGHFLLAWICLLGAYFHASAFDFGSYIWPSFLLWALDRFLRLVRVVSFANFGLPLKRKTTATVGVPSNLSTSTEAIITPLTNKFLRLTVRAPGHFRWRAGQSVYLSFFGGPEGGPRPSIGVGALPLQAHPFTIATVRKEGEENELKFFVRVRKGVTERLLGAVESKLTGSDVKKNPMSSAHVEKKTGVLLDGPYSSPPLLVGYDTVVLLGGGSGVAFTLSLMLDLIQRSKSDTLACRRLTFVWMVRHIDHVSWVNDELCKACSDVPNGMTLTVHLFITGKLISNPTTPGHEKEDRDDKEEDEEKELEAKEPATNNSSSSSSIKSGSSQETKANVLSMPHVHVHYARANVESLMANELRYARKSMSVNVCGTHSLAEAVRRTLRYPRIIDIMRGGPTVELHVEAFGGA